MRSRRSLILTSLAAVAAGGAGARLIGLRPAS